MRKLSDTPNIGGSNSAYPDGVIIDNAGAIVGTALTEILYGDLMQVVHKLKRLAGITENNLPDNETNGFQILTALISQGLPTWKATSGNVDFSKSKWVSYNNGLYYHKTTASTDTTPNLDTANWAVICYWSGSKIIFSDEQRLLDIETSISDIEAAIAPLIVNVNATELPLDANFSYFEFTPKYRKKGNVVMITGSFRRNSGVSNNILSIPSEIQPTDEFAFVAIPKAIDLYPLISVRHSIYSLRSAFIINGVDYDFALTYLLG